MLVLSVSDLPDNVEGDELLKLFLLADIVKCDFIKYQSYMYMSI